MDPEVQIYTTANEALYKKWLKEKDLFLDIYYYPEFLKTEAIQQNASYVIFTATFEKEIFIYPYLKKSLHREFKDYCDIFSPYGYAGPFATSEDGMEKGEQALINYFSSQKIISEFVRYHVLYNRDRKFKHNISNLQNRQVLFLNLSKGWKNIREKEFSATNRNLSSKLIKEGFEFSIADIKAHLADFLRMYYSTMDNAGAAPGYYFPESYFTEIYQNLGEKLVLARVSKGEVDYCYSLFFVSGNIVTYFLSARNIDYPKIAGNNLLLSEMIRWAAEKKYHFFNLGGGLTNSSDDKLFRFKNHFTKSALDYYIGKRIHDPLIYNRIISQWKEQHDAGELEKVKNILQFYH